MMENEKFENYSVNDYKNRTGTDDKDAVQGKAYFILLFQLGKSGTMNQLKLYYDDVKPLLERKMVYFFTNQRWQDNERENYLGKILLE